MTRYVSYDQAIAIHKRTIQDTGGSPGIRDNGGVESAIAQPKMTYGGEELYPSIVEKAAAICFSLINNHPFVDGNKRTAHATMELFLVLNGWAVSAAVDEQESVVLAVAKGTGSREYLVAWLQTHITRYRITDIS